MGGENDDDNPPVGGAMASNGVNDAYEAYATDSEQPAALVAAGFDESNDNFPVAGTPALPIQPHRKGDTAECMPGISRTEAISILRNDPRR